jgi:chromosomal replication initiation ATPase DnaA
MRVPDILKNGQHIVLDNFNHTWPSVPLLHLYNLVRERKGFMLIISNTPVAQLGFAPDDLASRLSTIPVVAIKPPDDFLLKEVMLKLFKDRQIAVEDGVVDYLVVRMERSFEEALRLVNLLDKEALAEKNRITIPLVSRVLKK